MLSVSYNKVRQLIPERSYYMKKKKFFIMLAFSLILMVMPVITYAADSYDVVGKARTEITLVFDYNVFPPYTTNAFKTQTDRVSLLFGAWGTREATYTFYLEERNADGTWTVVNKNSISGTSSISTSATVTPNKVYRVRATTTDKYTNRINIEVYEYIDN